jgi:hypothetical protein
MQHAALVAAGFTSMQRFLEQQLQPAAAYQGCVLPGDVLSAAALLVSETCCWTLLCLEVTLSHLHTPQRHMVCRVSFARLPS